MALSKFRLASVSIEGFKAFTTRKTIELSGKHLFVFGENGRGKSSIVEAVRWALFGLADRPETEIRNQFYPEGDCRVELKLLGPGGTWSLTRRLRAGSGKSDQFITDPNQKPVNQSEIFPHIARLGPKEGTHIIFAAQQASGRRPQADISDFDKVLYSYLHLEETPELLTHLDNLIEEQQEGERQVADKLSEIEQELRTELEGAELRLEELLRNPPWPHESNPTLEETETKVSQFVKQIELLVGETIPAESNQAATLQNCENAISKFTMLGRANMESQLARLTGEIDAITTSWDAKVTAETLVRKHTPEISRLEEAKSVAGQGRTPSELSNELGALKEHLERSNFKHAIAKQAESYCSRFSADECPVCLTPIQTEELLQKIRQLVNDCEPNTKDVSKRIEEAETNLRSMEKLEEELNALTQACSEARAQILDADQRLRELLDLSSDIEVTEIGVKPVLEALQMSQAALQHGLKADEISTSDWKKNIETLRHELRFQKYRRRTEELQRDLDTGLQPARDCYAQFEQLLLTTQSIRDKLQQEFHSALDQTLPKIGEMMTEVYQRLTKQISFEKVFVERVPSSSRGRDLIVRVSSSRVPDVRCNPDDVLNGQAINALRLAPYFVFSQFQSEALELDLLIVDDPSQSFDTSRVNLLMRELAAAASHAQLIIATHEAERFEPQISQVFDQQDYSVIRINGFDPEQGPNLEYC
jgi:DNA repair exonuclease SbcCD ATPase subunit